MYFTHSNEVWTDFPELRAITLVVHGVRSFQVDEADLEHTLSEVGATLDAGPEAERAPIRAWRQAYGRMGLKPTQYRCASEALLRRFRKDRQLPRFHPLIDMLNTESMRAAIPIAVFDAAHVAEGITVRPAQGTEVYTTFQGDTETPVPGEIIFADAAGQAHSRRWVFRQGATSVVRPSTDAVLIVAEALHDKAEADLEGLKYRLFKRLTSPGVEISQAQLIAPEARRLDFALA